MDISSDRARLSQKKTLDSLRRDLKPTDMVTVYHKRGGYRGGGIYCALIPCAQIDQVLSESSWNLFPGRGVPSAVVHYRGGEEKPEYLRFGNDNGIEPLVIVREFHGMRDNYTEISEEFRLFHNLNHDIKTDEYIKVDDVGNEETVVVVRPNCIQIRLKEIRQFLAIKEMYLSIQFDCRERSEQSLDELELKGGRSEQRDGLMFWGLLYDDIGDFGSHQTLSRLMGKRLIEPLPKSKSGFWGFAKEREEKHVEFIIDMDENGDEIAYTSDPKALANYFDANPNEPEPRYLTPVHFRKQVLDKYYQQPSKYSVEDSLLHCGGLWVMAIDNQHDDKVCAWLGDLGRDLPYQERLHWRAHNIPPSGSMSETFYKRQILALHVDSDRPDFLFKERYHELKEACKEHLGWQLLQPLYSDDEHHFQSLRMPATDEQRDFDELVLGLTKIMIDSLHVKRLNSLLSDEHKEGLGQGGIARLEAVLVSRGVEGGADPIAFLRKLQNLRSSSSAHRKGSRYKKIAKQFDIEGQSLREVFEGILWQALDVLSYFILLVGSGSVENVERNRSEEMYAILDEMVGFVDAGSTDGSVNHDDLIYELRTKL